jgi:hypothetical protein
MASVRFSESLFYQVKVTDLTALAFPQRYAPSSGVPVQLEMEKAFHR